MQKNKNEGKIEGKIEDILELLGELGSVSEPLRIKIEYFSGMLQMQHTFISI